MLLVRVNIIDQSKCQTQKIAQYYNDIFLLQIVVKKVLNITMIPLNNLNNKFDKYPLLNECYLRSFLL
jgi:hypothetical protein